MERDSSLQLLKLQAHQGRDVKKKVTESAQDYNGKGVLLQPHQPRQSFAVVFVATAAASATLSYTLLPHAEHSEGVRDCSE
jgi:hypothetical protein